MTGNTLPAASGPEIVAVLETVGHERLDAPAELAQRPRQQGRAADAVDVVIAVHEDPLAVIDRRRDAIDRRLHVGQRPGVVQPLEPRPQEGLRRGRVVIATAHQDSGDRLGKFELGDERAEVREWVLFHEDQRLNVKRSNIEFSLIGDHTILRRWPILSFLASR